MSIDVLLLFFAATLGWALTRAALCAVAATREVIAEGRSTALRIKLLFASAIAAAYGALTLAHAGPGWYPAGGGPVLAVIVAAAIMAIGALINGGCYFGSITYIGRGKAEYLFTLVGITLAARTNLAARLGVGAEAHLRPAPSSLELDTLVGIAILFSLAAGYSIVRASGSRLYGRVWYTLLAASAATLLYLRLPGWNYASVLVSLSNIDHQAFNWQHNALALMLFAGAIASSFVGGLWQPAGLTAIGSARRLIGGFVLASAAQSIPGGNDTLLAWAIPGFGGYGVLAYAVMLAVLLFCWWVSTRRQSSP